MSLLSILVVDRAVPCADGDAAAPGPIERLIAEGHRVTLVVAADVVGRREATLALEALGVAVHVAPPVAVGPVLERVRPDVVVLAASDLADAYGPALRRHAPGARAIVGFEGVAETPALFVADRELSDLQLRDALAGYLGAFAEDDAVSLVLPVADPAGAEALLGRIVPLLAALGHDPEHIPDVALTLWPAGAPAPRGARPAGAWAADDAPAADPPAPRAAVAVRLPADPADAAVQLAAVAACALPGGVELLLLAGTDDGEPRLEGARTVALPAGADDGEPRLEGARTVTLPVGAGRRLAQLRAVHATAAPIVVVLEPHALPEPGFAEPLIAAVERGVAFAGPVIAGHRGLSVAADGSLWPRSAADADAPQALPFDCLAATRATWLAAPHTLLVRDGHPEAQLGAWASERGGVAVADGATVTRQPAPPASVLICTRNRASELPDVVALLVACGAEDLVLIDNASTDDTAAVAAALIERHPGIVRCVTEERPGLSHARNAGAAAARHDLLLYIDDDARPAPGWLEAVSRELARPGVVNVGGPIAALWPEDHPASWPEPGLERYFSVLERGDADATLVPPDVVYGANWAVRREALRAAGDFDPAFGPGPGVPTNGDETSVAWRLHRRGLGATRFVTAAAVGHRIDPARISDAFLVRRSLGVGIERARHVVALDGVDPVRLTHDAGRAAGRLLSFLALGGELTLEDVIAAIEAAPLSQTDATLAADAAGELAACVLLMGETEARLGDLRLRVAPHHLTGTLVDPVAA
ncbi:MAG TPA: glycosyltransferase family 2 protein [Baekduia sp.]|jgi:GT2 family glycosyltransferase